jgi:hypothetical protein
MTGTGPPLIDQNNIVMPPQAAKRFRQRHKSLGGCLTRATGQHIDRSVILPGGLGFEKRDMQGQGATLFFTAIFRDIHRQALSPLAPLQLTIYRLFDCGCGCSSPVSMHYPGSQHDAQEEKL